MTKIMLVEDDNNLREIYEARLAAEGFTIVSAQDGEAALALAAHERPDLVITDVMMPKISGFEMLDILRNTETLRDVKVIMLTALGQAEDNARAGALGADRYLVKSQVTLEDIIKATHEVLDDPSETAQETDTTTAAAPAAAETAEPEAAAEAAPEEPAAEPEAPWQSAAPEAEEPVAAAEPVDPIVVEEPTDDVPAAEQDTEAAAPDFEPPVTDYAVPTDDTPTPETPAPEAAEPFSVVEPSQPTELDLPSVPDPVADYSQPSDDTTNATVPAAAQDEITNAADASQEESVIRAQIDQFLDDSSDTDTNSDVDAQPMPTEEVAITPQEPMPPAEEAEEEYEKDAATPDMGELPVHEEEAPAEYNTPAVAEPTPAPVEQAAPTGPTPGYPSQPYQLPIAPEAAVSAADAAPAPAPEPAPAPQAEAPQPQPVEQPEPVVPAQSAGDQLVSNAINDMSANSITQAKQPLLAPSEKADAAEAAAEEAPQENVAESPNGDEPAAHKRIITPLGIGVRPDINQLLAVEDAKNAASQASAGGTPQPGQYGQPWQQPGPGQQPQQQGQQPNANQPIDPNSISL